MSRMSEEIRQQPAVLAQTLAAEWPRIQSIKRYLEDHPVDLIVLAGRGTSDNAAQFGRYLIEITTGVPVSLAAASVITLYRANVRWKRALVVALSQSGESTDMNLVLEDAKAGGAYTIGITNEAESTLAGLAHETVLVRAGKEKSVAATKTYTGQLLCVYLLAYALGAAITLEDLEKIAAYAEAALRLEPAIRECAAGFRDMHRAVCVGRGLNYANSFEAALKMMETCYVVAERFSAADLLHGPFAMLEENFPAFAFCPAGVTWPAMSDLLKRMRGTGTRTLSVTDEGHPDLTTVRESSNETLVIPARIKATQPLPDDLLTPIPYIVPMQLFAAYLAETKGLNPDQPRSLSKVTKTV